ncbi:MAG: DNA-binding transcriptional repressor/biotin-[acetyl-CoA-carboxylase] ligase BirA [Candidatus Westeberhardia cardiocondylae]|nr:DNA-binding transcriptional repressor/biotin-[acetyl-CoA-carboxylase] ligase BirA [Candidatus Westeberhardia cardiocondylae]
MSIQLLNHTLISTNLSKGKIILLPIIHSTNQYLLEKANILKSGDICIAEHQTQGRGKYGKRWISSFGHDLCLSILWHFNKEITNIENLDFIISLLIKKILNKFGIQNIKTKWPNDLYLQNKKLAGILIEVYNITKTIKTIVIGIGINIKTKKNKKNYFQKNWINLQETGIHINRNTIAIQIIKLLRTTLHQYEKYYIPLHKKNLIYSKNTKFTNKKITI